jgi:hypothetical protein
MQEGVQPGQRVLSVSHPVEKGTMWDLQPGASLSRVKDAVRVTRATEVDMVFTSESVAEEWWAERQKEESEKEKEAAQNGNGGSRTGNGSALDQTLASPLLTSITGSSLTIVGYSVCTCKEEVFPMVCQGYDMKE